MQLTDTIIEYIEGRLAEEFKQDIYIKILEMEGELPEFESPTDMGKWMTRLVQNHYGNVKFMEDNRARLMEENDDLIRSLYGYNEENCDPLDELLALEEMEERINSLSPLLRDTFEAYYVEGRTPEEIAELTGDGIEAVRKRITRARDKVKGDNDG
jgi:DNA-directed RNA polymerase specialized sigma24 family protein